MKPGETNNTRPGELKNKMLRCARSLLGAVLMIQVATITILAVTNAGMTPQDQDFRIDL